MKVAKKTRVGRNSVLHENEPFISVYGNGVIYFNVAAYDEYSDYINDRKHVKLYFRRDVRGVGMEFIKHPTDNSFEVEHKNGALYIRAKDFFKKNHIYISPLLERCEHRHPVLLDSCDGLDVIAIQMVEHFSMPKNFRRPIRYRKTVDGRTPWMEHRDNV